MLIAVGLKEKKIVSFIIIFGTLSFLVLYGVCVSACWAHGELCKKGRTD